MYCFLMKYSVILLLYYYKSKGTHMFGYIRPLQSELKICEFDYYRAVYCGICNAHQKKFGHISKLTLSYDSVLIALLRMAVEGEDPQTGKKNCLCHPTHKISYLKNSVSVECAAAAGTLLAVWKVKDDISDERGAKHFYAQIAALLLSGSEKKASDSYREMAEMIKSGMSELNTAEKNCFQTSCASIDLVAGIFGRMMGEIASYRLEGNNKLIVKNAASAIGRWLYCIDALDDISEDEKKGRFNPFYLLYGHSALTDQEKLTISALLASELDSALDSLALASLEIRSDFPKPWAVCDNILRLGMPRTANNVLFSPEGKKRKKT